MEASIGLLFVPRKVVGIGRVLESAGKGDIEDAEDEDEVDGEVSVSVEIEVGDD